MSTFRFLNLLVLFFTCMNIYALDLDEKLRLIKTVYKLEPKTCQTNIKATSNEVNTGKILFNSVSLSGDRDISCANCHLDEFGSADGLPIAVGVGGQGKGYGRLENKSGVLVQRNTISLKGRASKEFSSFFWDGKVQRVDDRIISQFGSKLDGKFDTPLALAAILPLIERDEFQGEASFFNSNDIQDSVRDSVYYDRYLATSKALRQRFLHPDNEEDNKVSTALTALGIDLNKFELAHIGNFLAKFINSNFPCKESAWDRYLSGEKSAITKKQKKGAVMFYGKGRCASCHSGSLFSNFQFHSIGVPQGLFGPHSRHRDIGRASVTHKVDDIYRFRTPPLNEVKNTAPYGHNGVFSDLRSIVIYHFNPVDFYIKNPKLVQDDYYRLGSLLDSRDKILSAIELNNEKELEQLLEFLNAI